MRREWRRGSKLCGGLWVTDMKSEGQSGKDMKERQLCRKRARKNTSGGEVGLRGAEIVSGVDSYPSPLNLLISSALLHTPSSSSVPRKTDLSTLRRRKKQCHKVLLVVGWARSVVYCIWSFVVWEICANLRFLFLWVGTVTL